MTTPSNNPTTQVNIEDNNTANLVINGCAHSLTEDEIAKLENQLHKTSKELKERTTQTLQIARTENKLISPERSPFHIKGKHGCHHSKSAEEDMQTLNLFQLIHKFTWVDQNTAMGDRGYWQKEHTVTIDKNDRIDENKFINTFICNVCQNNLKRWHTQRQIFLPRVADELNLSTVTSESFTQYDEYTGPCDICGTAESAIYELFRRQVNFDIIKIEPPFHMCPTCHDYLVHADQSVDIDRKPISAHPDNNGGNIPLEQHAEPYPTATEIETGSKNDVEMEKSEFIDTISEYPYVNESTAESLYTNGFKSIMSLQEASKTDLKDIPLIGDGMATRIKDGAAEYGLQPNS